MTEELETFINNHLEKCAGKQYILLDYGHITIDCTVSTDFTGDGYLTYTTENNEESILNLKKVEFIKYVP